MKKSIVVIAVFVFAIGSAFTTRTVFNPTGWAKDALGNVVSGPTNESGCGLNKSTHCSIVGQTIDPVYDSQADINKSGKELEFNP